MDLEPLNNSNSTPLTDEFSSMTDHDASPTFLWIGDYIKFNALKTKKDKDQNAANSASENVSRNALVLTSPSCMIQPISGILISTQDLSPTDSAILGLQGLTETWQFDVSHLKDIAKSIWDRVSEKKWKIVEMGFSFEGAFPYGAASGML
jgi:hypothetical protein